MLTWLKKLFGSDMPSTPEIAKAAPAPVAKAPEVKATETKAKAKPAKKAPAKKAQAGKGADLDSMNKRDLLALAKEKGVKSNASMNKADIIKAIKNG